MTLQLNETLFAKLETIENGIARGWIGTLSGTVSPILLVNGRAVPLHKWPMERPDVAARTGLNAASGFEFELPPCAPGSRIAFYALHKGNVRAISTHIYEPEGAVNPHRLDVFNQITAAYEIAKKPGATAVVCWDGGHNPIGRAKVLYDICARHRPTVLFSFLFPEFSNQIWAPLRNSPMNLVAIPWEDRSQYFDMIHHLRMTFETVWICKNRYPSFDLAAQISGPETRLVLDHDDNEEHFSRSDAAREKHFGRYTLSLNRHLTDGITAHTAASITLAEQQGAVLVRHARPDMRSVVSAKPDAGQKTIGFIGTIRPHKGLVEALRAVKLYNWKAGKKVTLHIYGDFAPGALRQTLEEQGAVTKTDIAQTALYEELAQFDVVLTGFPGDVPDPAITKYQISSKIGDALAIGRPALVPYSESVADLEGVPGIYLFTHETFFEQLDRALTDERDLQLPDAFTLDGAYEKFAAVEATASGPDRAKLQVLSETRGTALAARPTLVLIWKQNDAGLYGRRVDQIARVFKFMFPRHRVIVLEFCHQTTREGIKQGRSRFFSDQRLQLDQLERKQNRIERGDFDVEYHTLNITKRAEAVDVFVRYAISERIMPTNALLVVYPLIPFFDELAPVLQDYTTVVDVVDNQFSWTTEKTVHTAARQYLALLHTSQWVIFNASNNLDYFRETGFLPPNNQKQTVQIIPNWYTKPYIAPQPDTDGTQRFSILYSGNMSDRFDWELLTTLAKRLDNADIHIVGGAARAQDKLERLLAETNVTYWGVLPEERLVRLIERCHLGIVPHVSDKVSAFMNPLKIEMYNALGLPVVTTAIDGIGGADGTDGLRVCTSHEDFIATVLAFKARHEANDLERLKTANEMPASARAFVDLLIDAFGTLDG